MINAIIKTSTLLLIMLSVRFSVQAQAQDKIYKKNKEVIECIIKEVGSEDIKYYALEVSEGVLRSILIDKITKIEFANGEIITFQDNFSNPENYEDQHKNLLKINLLEPLNGSTSFTLERSLKPGRSMEGTLGIIGLGFDPANYEGIGAYVGFGIKFLSKPDRYFKKMRYAHILKGFFVKPEILFSSYQVLPFEVGHIGVVRPTVILIDRVWVASAVFLINIGKQWVFDDGFALELFGGVGYGHKSRNDVPQYSIFIRNDMPLVGRIGLRIGILY